MSRQTKYKPKMCRETKKIKFRTEKHAGKAKMWIWSHDPSADMRDLHVYECDTCKMWHVGHKSYYEKIQAKEKTHVTNFQTT